MASEPDVSPTATQNPGATTEAVMNRRFIRAPAPGRGIPQLLGRLGRTGLLKIRRRIPVQR
ncbi:hypothetical protein GCM10009754_88030 [Amycolatopsis minnesotensis]|uniref:Uncharacterized protein n=1 Tax=Amycolatopsis minnesotensis TaxID=337894 RepID=A0ABN2SZ22_9PSEU